MNKEANKQRKLLIKKLKERGVSVTQTLYDDGFRSIPITLSIAELAKASGMFKGEGGTRHCDHRNKVADDFAKTHKAEAKRTANSLSYYYTNVGKGWTKKKKKPIDEQPS